MSNRNYFFMQLTVALILVTMIACKVVVRRPEWFGDVPREAVMAQRALSDNQ